MTYLPFVAETGGEPKEGYRGYPATVSTGIILAPAICPFCVWDDSKPIDERMHQ